MAASVQGALLQGTPAGAHSKRDLSFGQVPFSYRTIRENARYRTFWKTSRFFTKYSMPE